MSEPEQTPKVRDCKCDLCMLSKRINTLVLPFLSEEGKKVVDELQSRMAYAEDDIAWKNGKGEAGVRIRLGGRWYTPMIPLKRRKKKSDRKMVSMPNFDGIRTKGAP